MALGREAVSPPLVAGMSSGLAKPEGVLRLSLPLGLVARDRYGSAMVPGSCGLYRPLSKRRRLAELVPLLGEGSLVPRATGSLPGPSIGQLGSPASHLRVYSGEATSHPW